MTLICIGALLVVPELLKITHDALARQPIRRRIVARLMEGSGPARVLFTEDKKTALLVYGLLSDESHVLNLADGEKRHQWRFNKHTQSSVLREVVDHVLIQLAPEPRPRERKLYYGR